MNEYQFVTASPCFYHLSEADITAIVKVAHSRAIKTGVFIFGQGELAKNFYLLIEGRIRMSQVNLEGQQLILRLVEIGQPFGCFATIDGGVYPASAQAMQDSVILSWPRTVIIGLMQQFPQLALNVQHQLLARIQNLQDDCTRLVTQSVEQRVAHILLRLAHQAGRKVDDGWLIDVTLSRQDIAEMTGTTLHMVSRILSQWQKDGLVKSSRARVTLRQPQQLRNITEN